MHKFILVVSAALLLPSTASSKPADSVNPAARAGVPFDLSTGRPMFSVDMSDGTTLPVMLDTGSQGAVISQALADRFKLDVIGEAFIGSPYGGEPTKSKIVALAPMSLQGIALVDLRAVIIPDAMVPKDAPGLLISAAQFGGRPFTLDFATNRLVLSDKAKSPKSGWHKLDDRNMPRAEIAIGKQRVSIVIDTGNPGRLVLPRAFAEAVGAKIPDSPVGKIGTVDASFDRYEAVFDQDAVIAGQALRIGTVSVVDGMGANMGSKALAGFQLTIDAANRRWRLDRADRRKPLVSAKA